MKANVSTHKEVRMLMDEISIAVKSKISALPRYVVDRMQRNPISLINSVNQLFQILAIERILQHDQEQNS